MIKQYSFTNVEDTDEINSEDAIDDARDVIFSPGNLEVGKEAIKNTWQRGKENLRVVIILGLLCILVIIFLLLREDTVSVPPTVLAKNEDPASSRDNGNADLSAMCPLKEEVSTDPLKTDQQDLALRSLCDSTTWQVGLYLNCTNINNLDPVFFGGLTVNPQGTANVRNAIITCIRWAIDAGMGFVMPRIAVRSETNPKFFTDWADFGFLFDENHFKKKLYEECPQLNIVETHFDNSIEKITKIITESKNFLHYHYGLYRRRANNYVKKVGVDSTLVIWENEPLFTWDFFREGITLKSSIHDALKFNPTIRALSTELLNLIKVPYLGFHFRGEADSGNEYEYVANWFVRNYKAEWTNITTVYIAIGNIDIENRFRANMTAINLTVISKYTLAEGNPQLLSRIKELKFDQLAAVEMDILKKSDYFFGCAGSSYSYGIAYERADGILSNCNCHLQGVINPAFLCGY